jgi:reverse gyrase
MSKYTCCPKCGHEASGGLFGGVYIKLHKCRSGGHVFCNDCKDGDSCPKCGSDNVWWDHDEAYTNK